MRVITFPNGLTLTSSALSAGDIENLFQLAIMQTLGIDPGTLAQGTLTDGSNQVTVDAIGLAVIGQLILGRGIPPGTLVTAISGNVITMSAKASWVSLYGAGGYGDSGFGAPSPWTTTVAIGGTANAFYNVRVGWQLEGQPGWNAPDDVVTITATIVEDPYNKIRDVLNAPNDETTVTQTTNYTRCWEIRFSVYGPTSTDNARLIKSCLRLDWLRSMFAASNLYLVANEVDPIRAPENFNKQWWDRSDFRARYYEAVQETITQQTVATAEVILEAAIGGFGSDGYGDDPYGDLTTVDIDFTVSAS